MEQEVDFTHIDRALVMCACDALERVARRGLSVVTAESLTGGLIAAVLSEAPGASEHLHGGFVVYTKEHKATALGVPPGLLAREGAVNKAVACAMAQAALQRSPADIAVAATGVAGPQPDADGNPVGLVHFAAARRGFPTLHEMRHFGDIGRGAVRYQSAMTALALVAHAAALCHETAAE